jgi:hypothetical protein
MGSKEKEKKERQSLVRGRAVRDQVKYSMFERLKKSATLFN